MNSIGVKLIMHKMKSIVPGAPNNSMKMIFCNALIMTRNPIIGGTSSVQDFYVNQVANYASNHLVVASCSKYIFTIECHLSLIGNFSISTKEFNNHYSVLTSCPE